MTMLRSVPEGPFVLNVYKPSGVTSAHVVNRFKHMLPKKTKIGHFGTLDPFASGVLLLGIGGASKINDFVHKYLPKTYLALGRFGSQTDTGDYTGCVIREKRSSFSIESLKELKDINDNLKTKFLGNYYQTPPSFSAVKYKGKALYKWAREGAIIKKDPVLREIYKLEVLPAKAPYFLFRVQVSSGTYIRTLFEDIADCLGEVGTLAALTRESIGKISIKDALNEKGWLPKGERFRTTLDWSPHCLLRMDEILPFKKAILSPPNDLGYINGKQICRNRVASWAKESFDQGKIVEPIWITNQEGKLLGLSREEKGFFSPYFNLPTKSHF
tara:strand:- start:344 stop:1327 length:984 start_codon:yes stop_codon:yes gene_type:complete